MTAAQTADKIGNQMMRKGVYVLVMAAVLALAFDRHPAEEPPFNAQGEIVGEVTSNSAIIHTRLTLKPEPNPITQWWRIREIEVLPYSVDLPGEVEGREGWARIHYGADASLATVNKTTWKHAAARDDFTLQFEVDGLQPDTRYYYRAELSATPDDRLTRLGPQYSFRTAPDSSAFVPIDFVSTTCAAIRSRDIFKDGVPWGFEAYASMAALNPDFFVHHGDIVYYDTDSPLAVNEALARFHWHRMMSDPTVRSVLEKTPAYFMKDDHDYRWDDAWPQQEVPRTVQGAEFWLTDEMGQRLFREAVPMGEKTYRTQRWGKHLQIWVVEGRDFRSPNDMPDGPEKTLWGAEQKAWLMDGLRNSTATFKLLLTPTPMVGPDRETKRDNHANELGFRTEGRAFLDWVATSGIENFYVITGDRHWQYHSIDSSGIEEFSVGAVSDSHAAVNQPRWGPDRQPYFREAEGGFLHVRLRGTDELPQLHFVMRDVDGSPLYVITRTPQ
jgi:alkaline phosphatase D